MYSFPNFEPVACPVLTVASCPACRFLRRQIRWCGIPISSRILQKKKKKNIPVCCDPCSQRLWHSEWSRSKFLKNSLCLFNDLVYVGSLISGSSAFSKSSLYIWMFLVHVLLKPGLKDSEHNLGSMWNECSCAVIWAFFGIAFLWSWNENLSFPVLWPLLWVFQICWHV